MKQKSILGLVGTAVLGLSLLAGCSSSPDSEAPSDEPVTEDGSTPGDLKRSNAVVNINTCDSSGGVVTAEGTVRNPNQDTQSYRVAITVLDGDATKASQSFEVLDLGSNETHDWELEMPVQDGDYECISQALEIN